MSVNPKWCNLVVLNKLFHIFFAFTIFAGSVGFDVFKHICSKDGITISLFTEDTDHCAEEKQEFPSCCKKEQPEKEKGCCSDEEQIVQLKFQYFQKAKNWTPVQIASFIPCNNNFALVETELEETLTFDNWSPPPPPDQSIRRAIIQVYTI